MKILINIDLINSLRGFKSDFNEIASHFINCKEIVDKITTFAIHFYIASISNLENLLKMLKIDIVVN